MALTPSPDTQAALGDQVSGAFAGEAKFQSGKITGAQEKGLAAGLDFRKSEQELRGLKEANPLALDLATEAVRNLARYVEWRANRIDTRAVERARRAQGHTDRLEEIRGRNIQNAEAQRKAEIASEVLRVLDLPGGGSYTEKPALSFESLRERWNEHWADLDNRRAKRDRASAEAYRGGAQILRGAAQALEDGWKKVMQKHELGVEQTSKEADQRRLDATDAAQAAQDAFDRVMQKGPAQAIAARGEVMATQPGELAKQQDIVAQRTEDVVNAATNRP